MTIYRKLVAPMTDDCFAGRSVRPLDLNCNCQKIYCGCTNTYYDTHKIVQSTLRSSVSIIILNKPHRNGQPYEYSSVVHFTIHHEGLQDAVSPCLGLVSDLF
jgi:hypothetical protein